MKLSVALAVALLLAAPAAMAEDSSLSGIGSSVKDAAVQAGKDKAQEKVQEKMGGMSGMSGMTGSSSATGTQVPSSQAVKDAAKDKAKEKASDAAGSAIDKVLAK